MNPEHGAGYCRYREHRGGERFDAANNHEKVHYSVIERHITLRPRQAMNRYEGNGDDWLTLIPTDLPYLSCDVARMACKSCSRDKELEACMIRTEPSE